MEEAKFVSLCKKVIADYFNENAGSDTSTRNIRITPDDVYVVWLCKTLQNSKALVSTIVSDGMYYEVTYNGDKGEAYVDVYQRQENFVVKLLETEGEKQ